MFSAKGTVRGRKAEVTWDKGQIAGDVVAVERIKAEARGLEGEAVGPVCGPYTLTDHLSDALSAVHIVRMVFDDGAEFSGDVPEPPELDEPDSIP